MPSRRGVSWQKEGEFHHVDVSLNGPLPDRDKSQSSFPQTAHLVTALVPFKLKHSELCGSAAPVLEFIITVAYLFGSKRLQARRNLAYAPWNAAQVNAKCSVKVNGCNLLGIDFLLPLPRGAVCQVQSPAMRGRQQTAPIPRIRGHQLAGGAGRICLHAGLKSNRLLCFLN